MASMAFMARNGRRFSPWWLPAVALLAIVLYGIGGGLVSSFDSCIVDIYINGGICSTGPYYAGLAFLSFGSLCTLAWFVLLIIFILSKRRPVQYNPTTVPMNGGNFGAAQNGQQPQAQAQQYYGAQNQYPQPAIPNKEAYSTVQPLQQNAPSPPYPVPNKDAYDTAQPLRQNAPTPPYPIQELESPSAPQPQQINEKICGRCEAVVHSPFCPRCGSAVTNV